MFLGTSVNPERVLTTMGKNAMKKAITNFGISPIPNHTVSTGAMATLGTAWKAISIG